MAKFQRSEIPLVAVAKVDGLVAGAGLRCRLLPCACHWHLSRLWNRQGPRSCTIGTRVAINPAPELWTHSLFRFKARPGPSSGADLLSVAPEWRGRQCRPSVPRLGVAADQLHKMIQRQDGPERGGMERLAL